MNYIFYDYCSQCTVHDTPKSGITIHHAKNFDDVKCILEKYGNKLTPWFYVACDDETLNKWTKGS